MDKTLNGSVIYGIATCVSLLLAGGYCATVRKKENWLIWLYFSIFIANLGYFTLAISTTLEEALLANRLAYLGSVFLPLFMLMTIMKVCKVHCTKSGMGTLVGSSCIVFLIVASQGYSDLYYKEVSLTFVNGMAKLVKVYGPLHTLYYIYLFTYIFLMIGVIIYSVKQRRVSSYKHAGLLLVVVCFNICIWLIEQFINWDFEFLSISYIGSELLLLLLYGMIQEYEEHKECRETEDLRVENVPKVKKVLEVEGLKEYWPELCKLSSREMDVLQKIVEDKKRKEIADELCITENTVKKHISSIFAKLNIANRNELFERIAKRGDM